jgi:hypothetical protein
MSFEGKGEARVNTAYPRPDQTIPGRSIPSHTATVGLKHMA